ncbi:hypothetical protein GCM10009839_81220 [Catenulispora yoronensis]|uniref:FtsX-like permease family protein n=1 Tax=Catenulispora yoronensis TaxID=450799 RepID=A0ABP5GW08_9ACTN
MALLALFAGATAATAAAVPYQTQRSDRAIIADTVGAAPVQDRDIVLAPGSSTLWDDTFLPRVTSKVLGGMPPLLTRLVSETDITVAATAELPVDGLTGPGGLRVHLRPVRAYDYEQHVRFVAGTAPVTKVRLDVDSAASPATAKADGEVAISKSAADSLGLHVGSVLHTVATFTGGHLDFTVTVSGLFTSPDTADAPFWSVAEHGRAPGIGSICGTDGPDGYVRDPACAVSQAVWRLDVLAPAVTLVTATAALPGSPAAAAEMELAVDPDRMRKADPTAVQSAVHELVVGGRGLDVSTDDGGRFPIAPSTKLGELAGKAGVAERQTRLLDYVVLGATVAGGLAAFFLMLRMVVARRSAEIVLCKARGASPRRLAARFTVQSGFVVGVGSVVGVLGACAAGVASAGGVGGWPAVAVLAPATGAVVFGRVLAHADHPVSARREPQEADAGTRTPRLVRDLAVPLAAAAAVGVLRTSGARNGSGSVDWLAVAAPALLAFAAALVVVRAVPVLWAVPFGVARRRRGTLPFVASALAGRRVRVLAAPLAGLVAATAAATFAARLDSSVAQRVRDDALYAVGAGARVEAVPDRAMTALNRGAEVFLPDGFAARAAALPGTGQVLGAYVGAAGVSDNPDAPSNVAVLVADSAQLRSLTSRAAGEADAHSGSLPKWWPSRPVRPGAVTALVSPDLARLAGDRATLDFGTGAVDVELVGTADLPTGSVVGAEFGPGYVVLPADQLGAAAPKANAVWITGHPDLGALRKLPGVQPWYPTGTYAQVVAAGYADARTDAAHAVLRMAELLSVGFALLCLLQTLGATRAAARDSALLLRVFGMAESRGRLLGPAITLPLLLLALAAGLAMGTAFAPLLGDVVPGAPSDGWLLPVAGVAVLGACAGVALEAGTRGRQRMSVRLRAAEFE